MKNILRILTLLIALAPFNAFAASSQVIHVGVDGMVCDFCAQSLKELFLKKPGVTKVDISLEKKLVTLDVASDKKLADKEIEQVIDYAGYKITGIHRMPVTDTKK